MFVGFHNILPLSFPDPVRGRGVLDNQLLLPRGLRVHLLPAGADLAHPAGHVRARRVPAHAQAPFSAQARDSIRFPGEFLLKLIGQV